VRFLWIALARLVVLLLVGEVLHDLYTKTMKFAPHTNTLGIIRDLKAYGLTAEAEHFESKVRVRHTERKKQRAKEKYTH
jgi:hypothetical protein